MERVDAALRELREQVERMNEAVANRQRAHYAPPAPSRRRLVLPRPASGIAPVVSIAEYQHR